MVSVKEVSEIVMDCQSVTDGVLLKKHPVSNSSQVSFWHKIIATLGKPATIAQLFLAGGIMPHLFFGRIAEVDEIKERISVLNDKIQKTSKLDSFLIKLPGKGVPKSVIQTFNHETPARLDEIVVLMGKGVQENITLLEELYDKDKLTLIS